MNNKETDQYARILIKYLIDNNLYEEIQKRIYIEKIISDVKKSIIYFGDRTIKYDKYIKIDNQRVLIAQNIEEFTYQEIEKNEVIDIPITEKEFCIYLFLNKEFLKTLLDLFDIKNNLKLSYNKENKKRKLKIS